GDSKGLGFSGLGNQRELAVFVELADDIGDALGFELSGNGLDGRVLPFLDVHGIGTSLDATDGNLGGLAVIGNGELVLGSCNFGRIRANHNGGGGHVSRINAGHDGSGAADVLVGQLDVAGRVII